MVYFRWIFTTTRKMKVGKFWNMIFHSMQHIVHLPYKMVTSEGGRGEGLHILYLEKAQHCYLLPIVSHLYYFFLFNFEFFFGVIQHSFTSLDLKLFSLQIREKWLFFPYLWQDFPVAGHFSRLNSWLKPQYLHFWRECFCDTLSISIGYWYLWFSVNVFLCTFDS